MFAFTCADKVHDGRITIEEFLDFFGGFDAHWAVSVPTSFPKTFKEVRSAQQLKESPVYPSLKHFVENRLRTELELD